MERNSKYRFVLPDLTTRGNADFRKKISAEKVTSEMAETNEDSSYDSDFETDETCTPGLSSHHDVSRTVSDTLGAEFAEYVNSDPSIVEIKKSPGYTPRLEFGLKLGYPENLIQTALKRLKPEPSNNELLEELIKLGAAAPKPVLNLRDEVTQEHQLPNIPSVPQLRHIVIDGSNVAMSHGNSCVFSCKGIKICVDWFKARGHNEITVFVPKWRKEACSVDNQIMDQEILNELEKERLLVYTPSRLVSGRRYVCYDDRYILKLAAQVDGVVVSNDNYRDLIQESADFRKVVEERILMYSFVNDRFMPPDDPMGRSGPTLDTFLSIKRPDQGPTCPYGRKCTYGNKCRYNHPERGNLPQKLVASQLTEFAQKQMAIKMNSGELSSKRDLKTKSLPLSYENQGVIPKKLPLSRTRSAVPAPSLSPMDPTVQASMVSNFNRAQMEYQHCKPLDYHMPPPPPPQALDRPCKSHSIDNLATNFQDMSLVPPHMSHPGRQNIAYNQPSMWMNPDHPSPIGDQASWNNMYVNKPEQQPEMANMHRKLHRQLTINPNYDPRLYRMHGSNNLPPAIGTPQGGNMWPSHQVVGRMASDPTAGPSWVAPAWNNPPPPSVHHDPHSRSHFLRPGLFTDDKVHNIKGPQSDEADPQKLRAQYYLPLDYPQFYYE